VVFDLCVSQSIEMHFRIFYTTKKSKKKEEEKKLERKIKKIKEKHIHMFVYSFVVGRSLAPSPGN